MPFFNSIISWVTEKRFQQITWYKLYPQDIQNEVLFQLIKDCENTEWGKKYDFATISCIEDFQKRVPINDYDGLKPYIERIRQGEQNILWHSPIKWFAKSSGTTNDKSKFIPVSKEALENCHFRGSRDTVLLYNHNYPDSSLWKGKSLVLGGSHQISQFSVDSYFGDLSAILIQNMPFWAQFYRTPELSIALMDEWEEKIDKIVEITSEEKVVSLAGVPSWTLVLLKRMLEKEGKTSVLDIWPNLELFIHGGVNFGPYREQFKAIIPSETMRYMEVYNASEGFFAPLELQEMGKEAVSMFNITYDNVQRTLYPDSVVWIPVIHEGAQVIHIATILRSGKTFENYYHFTVEIGEAEEFENEGL